MVTPEAQQGTPPQGKKGLIGRMIGAARLDVHTFEEVKNDASATKQALLVVVIVAVAPIVPSIILGLVSPGELGVSYFASAGGLSLILGIVPGVVRWVGWVLLAFILGTTLFKTADTHANWSQLARTTGFAQVPGVLLSLPSIPLPLPIEVSFFVEGLVVWIVLLWQLLAMVIAVRQALDYTSTWRAVGVVVVGFIIVVIPLYFIADQLGVGGMFL